MKIVSVLVTADPRTQEVIAREAGISPSYLSAIVKGNRPLTVESCAGLSFALGVEPDVLAEDISQEELVAIGQAKAELRAKKTGAPSPVSEPATSHASYDAHVQAASHEAPELPANVPPIDRSTLLDKKLARRLLRSVERSDDHECSVPVYQVAASAPEDPDCPKEKAPAWIPKAIRDLFGKAKVFGLRIKGESMLDAGIEPDDIVFAKRPSSRPADESIVIAYQQGGTTCKRLRGNTLIAESPVHEDVQIVEDDNQIYGLVLAIYKPPK